jgi:hypothetical protein
MSDVLVVVYLTTLCQVLKLFSVKLCDSFITSGEIERTWHGEVAVCSKVMPHILYGESEKKKRTREFQSEYLVSRPRFEIGILIESA